MVACVLDLFFSCTLLLIIAMVVSLIMNKCYSIARWQCYNRHFCKHYFNFFCSYIIAALILSAFFYAYPILQIPSGYLAGRLSAKYIGGVGLFVASILSLLTPLAVTMTTSIAPLVTVRVLQGLAEVMLRSCSWPDLCIIFYLRYTGFSYEFSVQ